MAAAWQELPESGPFLLAGYEQVIVCSEQQHTLLDVGQQGLHHLVALLQQLQLPLQNGGGQDLGQVAQLGDQLLQPLCVLGCLQQQDEPDYVMRIHQIVSDLQRQGKALGVVPAALRVNPVT